KTAGRFNPVKFNADEWVEIAKNAGMKYIVITAKHHDGFSMYDSKLTDYSIVKATPFKRDVIAELARACREQGVRFGIYYSLLDWHYSLVPGFFGWIPNFRKYFEFMKGQVGELLTNYGPVCALFFDGDWMLQWTAERGEELELLCRGLQPEVIINNRVGKRPKLADFPWAHSIAMSTTCGDYETPEQFVPGKAPGRDWETCMTMNDTWGYKSFDNNWKSSRITIRKLIDIASKGGNFLLNVGPDGDGLIPEPSVRRLERIGDWMRTNGDSIYGTTAGPLQDLKWGRCTQKAGKVFLHVFDWPKEELVVEGLKKVAKAHLLSDSLRKSLPLESSGGALRIKLPPDAPDPVSSTVVLEI
ncbi:MAG: alpha-L-fucosidase, partial [Patescibacteria group bacterium]